MKEAWRSLLFVAADDERRLQKIHERGADAVILDLEDAVPPERKAFARHVLPAAIDRLAVPGCDVIVRINAGWHDAMADLAVAVNPRVSAIMAPKIERPGTLDVLAEMAAEVTIRHDRAHAPRLIALIESTAGLISAASLAAHPALCAIALGTEDFALSLGVLPTPEMLTPVCSTLAVAAAAHGIQAIGLPVSIATIADETTWQAGVERAKALGMTGALCIHPRQVAPANQGFSPRAEDVRRAREVVTAWAARGDAGVVQVHGRMVDLPVLRAARKILVRAGEDT